MLTKIKAVIFDIGGVVMRSPFIAIDAFEREHHLPKNYLNCSIASRGSNGAWQKFERGELALFSFYQEFSQDLSDTHNGNIWYKAYCERKSLSCPELPENLNVDGRELFGAMMREAGQYDPHFRQALLNLRALSKFRVIALTNNFSRTDIPPSELAFLGWADGGATPNHLRDLFDDFCDSSVMGMRKPDPEFYLGACARNGIDPKEAVFLDDIGVNLKTARQLGMKTIHVAIGQTANAVKELETLLGVDLVNPSAIAGDVAKL